MPDFNQYSTNPVDVRPQPPNQGLSLIIAPAPLANPLTLNKGGEEEQTAQQRMAISDLGLNKEYLGETSSQPGAVADYNEVRRYDNNNLLYTPDVDNEDRYAKNQGFFKSVGSGLGRLVLTTGTKLGTGVGYMAGLVGIGNKSEDYGGNDFSSWIAGAADNGLAKWFDRLENQTIKQDWLPIYQEAADRDKGFFHRMATDLNFWTDDTMDGLAFTAAAFVPGMTVSKLAPGARLLTSLAKNMGYADEATALAKEGIAGGVESNEALAAGKTVATPTVSPTTTQAANGFEYIPRIINGIDNATAARAVDVGTTSVINTAAESMFEAQNVKKDVYDKIINEKDEFGNYKYTTDQAKNISAKSARDTYLMNLGALSVSNLWEANLFYKQLASRGTETLGKFGVTGLLDDVSLQKKTFGQKIWDIAKIPLEGVAAEGLWEENIQLAIQRINESNDNFDLDFTDKIGKVFGQYAAQTGQAFAGKDPEAASNIGLGGLTGALLGRILEGHKENAVDKIANLNQQVSMFKTLGNIYETGEDGKIKLVNGGPIVDVDKLMAYAASVNKILNYQEVARNLESKGINELAKIYKDEIFARYAKAHFDNGLGQLLHQRLSNIKNISAEDLAILGYDPSSKTQASQQTIEEYKQRADDLEKVYDNIQRNILPIKGDKNGSKFYNITDKLFYMSARVQSISNQLASTKAQQNTVKGTSDAMNAQFLSATDQIVDGYNQRFEAFKAAQRADEVARATRQYRLGELTRPISETRNGISVEAPSKLDRLRRRNSSVAVSLPQNYELENQAFVKQRQDELDAYVTENKEILDKMRKDSRGRYMYEVANKNLLPSVKEFNRLDIVQAELELAHDNTLKQLSRLADINYGTKYYDDVYAPALANQAQKVQDEIARQQDLYNQQVAREAIGKVANQNDENIGGGEEVEAKPTHENISERERDLNNEKEYLEGLGDRTVEQENRLDEINKELDDLQDKRDDLYNEEKNEVVVGGSLNIAPEDKKEYKEILNELDKNRKRVVKIGDGYEVDGVPYRSVTRLIGDTISPFDRVTRENAINAGLYVDALVKGFFDTGGDSAQLRASMSDKMSDVAYDRAIKKLNDIKKQLEAEGIEIVKTNAVVFDEERKVAGEIDILGVDKNGNFKIYEVSARQDYIYRMYGKTGVGISIRDLDQARMSAYRNIFANQYGSVPNEIAVKFPFVVSYDKKSPTGFITNLKVKDSIRLQPSRNVTIKRNVFEPIRTGSKFDHIDLLRFFAKTFLTNDIDLAKRNYAFRNIALDKIKNGMILKVRNSGESFQKAFAAQKELLDGRPSDFKPTKISNFDNLYALVGDKELGLYYEGQIIGYMSPAQALAYKDDNGFHVLDENTDPKTYADVTHNSESTFPEFQSISRAYKFAYGQIVNDLNESGKDEFVINNKRLQELYDPSVLYGSLDKAPYTEQPKLSELDYRGVMVNGKQVTTVVNIDAVDNPFVIMDKTKGKNVSSKYYEVDKWAIDNMDKITDAITDKNGKRFTNYVSIVEMGDGSYNIIPLKKLKNSAITDKDDFVSNLGDNFLSTTTKTVFKDQSIKMVPKFHEEMMSFDLKDREIAKSVYPGVEISEVEGKAKPSFHAEMEKSMEVINNFYNALLTDQKTEFHKQFGETDYAANIMDKFNNSLGFSSVQEYLDYIGECKI